MIKRFSVVLILALLLPACSFLTGEGRIFEDRKNEYLKAEILPTMAIPENLDSYTLDPLYVIPEESALEIAALDGIPMPRPIETARRQGVIIQSLNDKNWIVLDATLNRVWPRVRDYWSGLQIILEHEDPVAGVMETVWLEVDSDNSSKDKYQVIIEPGLHPGYSEIYVKHMAMPQDEEAPLELIWPEESISDEREYQILESLSQYLADRNDIYQASTSSLLAGSIQAESKANLIENSGGNTVLQLKIDFERAWVQVRQSIEKAEIPILDSDKEQSYYTIAFSGVDGLNEDSGFFGRLFGGSNELQEPLNFNVRLNEDEGAINVVAELLDSSDQEATLKTQLLELIDENLI